MATHRQKLGVQFDSPPKTPEGRIGSSTLNGNVERRVKSGNVDVCEFFWEYLLILSLRAGFSLKSSY